MLIIDPATQNVVKPAMVVALKAHKQAPTSEGARQTHHHLHCFRTGGHKSHAVCAWHVVDDALGQLHLRLGLQHARGYNKKLFQLRMKGVLVFTVAVSPDARAHTNGKVDQLTTINVPQPLTHRPVDEHRRQVHADTDGERDAPQRPSIR